LNLQNQGPAGSQAIINDDGARSPNLLSDADLDL
jgi:hypothetical protein